MDFTTFLKFLMNDFLFSFIIIIVSFTVGWFLYDRVILGKINLRDSLFEKDNFAAWIEFIGAFIFPVLYLAAKAIQGSSSDRIFIDLLTCVVYVLVYIVLFTVLRLLSGYIIKLIGEKDDDGKIKLNAEIYSQKNPAAALFSVTLSIIFVSIIRFFDILPEYFLISLLKMSSVLIFTLLALIVYSLVLRKKTTLFKEIFIDNNTAAGVGLAGFVFAVETILTSAVEFQTAFDYVELIMFSIVNLIIFGVLSVLFKYIFTRMIKVDIWNEVYGQNNVGAAIGQAALYIGIANVIIHFIK